MLSNLGIDTCFPFVRKDELAAKVGGIMDVSITLVGKKNPYEEYAGTFAPAFFTDPDFAALDVLVLLKGIERTSATDIEITFVPLQRIPGEDTYQRLADDLVFTGSGSGIILARCADCEGVVVLNMSSFDSPRDPLTSFDDGEAVLEPAQFRYLGETVWEIIVATAILSGDDVGKHEVVNTFNGATPPTFEDGYNVSVLRYGNTLGFYCAPGAGLGLISEEGGNGKLLTINGVGPDINGDIPLAASSSVILSSSGNTLNIALNLEAFI